MMKNIARASVGLSILLLLSGCGCDSTCDCNKESCSQSCAPLTDDVLVSQNGQVRLTLQEFKDFVQEAMGADQQMQLMAQFMPDFEEQLFERAKFREVVLNAWAAENNIAQKEEYKKQKKQAEKAIESMLNQQMFVKEHVGEVTDDEALAYYNENKDKDQNLMVSPEGVEAKALTFEKEADAKAFLAKATVLKNDIDAAAKEMKKEVDDLGLVTQMSMIEPVVKDKIIAAKKMPGILPIIKAGDKEFWVVSVIKKEKAQYRPFEQAVDMLKETLMNKKIEEIFDAKIPEYIEKYGIKVNRSYFDKQRTEREAQQAKMMKEMEEKEKGEAKKTPAPKELASAATTKTA